MGGVSRRTLLAGSAGIVGSGAVGAGPAGLSLAAAATPAAGQQVPSAYRYKVGAVEVTAISDGQRTVPLPDNFVRNQPREVVNAALRAAFLAENSLSIPFNVLLVNIGGRLALIDSGNGPSQPGAPVGLLPGTLAALGVDPASIEVVVISHFHGDHINGLLKADGTAAFPKAEIRVPEPEWAFWMDDGAMSRAPDAQKSGFQNARRVFAPLKAQVSPYAWEAEVLPGLAAVGTPGHTPGHTSFTLQSGNDSLFIQSDLTNIPALFVRNPGWHAMYDMDPVKAEETRRRIYDRLSGDRTQVAGYHFPFPAVAYVEQSGTGFHYIPALWKPVL